VSFLGPEGSYSHQAAFHEFGSSAELIPQGSFEEVVEEVERDRCTFGIVPIENSIEGSIGGVLDVLSKSDLKIISEYYERISHCLLSKSGEMNEIEIIASHPQALGQCKGWIGNHLKRAEIRETSSTAKAAMLASRNRRFAAVVGELASTIYKLRVVATKIEDSAQNTTRFWVIGKTNPPPTGDDKTSIVFSLKDEPGALQRSFFLPFSEAKINLTKIESRPSKERPWEYIFFIDFLGHIIDKKVQRVLSKVRRRCINLKVLGSYPRGESDK
jgi:chorismate mutase/prephenate dehydratase